MLAIQASIDPWPCSTGLHANLILDAFFGGVQ